MSLLDLLSQKDVWEKFYKHKTSLSCPKSFVKELRAFIDEEAYLPICDAIEKGSGFPLPKKSVICKLSSQKKRTVYSYPAGETTVLKLLTRLMITKYDFCFSDNLYSFRPNRAAKDAVMRLRSVPGIDEMYAYKADISNYFNSIPIPLLLPKLEKTLEGDRRLFDFLAGLLSEKRVFDGHDIIREQKGIMAGVPVSAFLANLYLKELDALFAEKGIPYARYSDDIIVFAESRELCRQYAEIIRSAAAELGLEINPEKENFFSPSDGWEFLGFSVKNGSTDLSGVSLKKMKGKMRRKAHALRRWQLRNELDPEKAASAFIRIFNRKLFENAGDNELTWAKWYFPVITSTEGLRVIDLYAQEQLRFLLSGKKTKSRYNVRYEKLKSLGYRSLVNEYYKFRRRKSTENDE